ncbi:zinc-binding dehydrogenase [Actinosynnema pretiosum subsp. pretiosum]|uniref:Alcohol dehydrogenase zinc-binding domain protein n=2 Tax=Actinosynnema TaxID=40566 RepID=C6WS17_ACTMD|nr:zinc-binding dehydrogenase [Actinosynnema mirum]ACU38837.1 Alcohol dehydrogenase zinc-binding domain protein [Actinosynnema mirum DSM 43827]AXX32429.1 Alcohol dehydrogenase [Actinosynnema pretiosum subsp. pretiosum]QUF03643.1 zinc-binding dehydrogenase [Actinosynnema pretiosum subsp. pretiosum]
MRTRGALLREVGGPLEVVDLELDPPGPGELLVRVGATGLCHSDLSVLDGSRVRPLPMVLGHETAGEVLEVGEGAAGFAPGDHVVLSFVPACGACRRCAAGRPALCEPGAAANRDGALLSGARRLRLPDGTRPHHHLGVSGFAEHAVVSARSATKAPVDLPFEVAALFGCAVLTGAGAVLHSARVGPGDVVAVFGLGGVGLAALLAARAAGAARIVAVDLVAGKRELALSLGATDAVAAGPDAVEAVRELTGGGAEKVVDTTGVPAALAQAYAATAPGGTTVTVGLPHPDRELVLPALSLVAEERTLKGSYLGSCVPGRDVPRFIALHRAGLLPVERLLSGRLALEEVGAGFDRLAGGEAVRQVVVP